MVFKREKYVEKLIAGIGNGLVKIITGGRRCGKSFLLFNLFHNRLIETGTKEEQIIELSLDERKNRHLRNPDILLQYVEEKIRRDGNQYCSAA